MYKIILFLFIGLVMTACGYKETVQQEILNETSDLEYKLDEYFTAFSKLKEFNGNLLVYKNGKEIIRKAYNINLDGNSSTFINTESQFYLHSISKLMATALIIKLENEGKLNRRDNLNIFFTDFPNGDKITIQHLLDHKSGLPRDYSNLKEHKIDLNPERIIELSKNEKLEFEPGTKKLYSNIGFQIIYSIIGKVTGKTFELALKDNIFTPLKMNASGAYFNVNKENLIALANSHQLHSDSIVQVESLSNNEFRQARLYSTIDDLKLFLNFVKTEPYKTLLKNSNGVIQHNGYSEGSYAYVHTNTILNYSYVFLSNYDEFNFSQTSNDILNILQGKMYTIPEYINRKVVSVSTETLGQYIGKYDFESLNHTILEFRIEDSNLVLYQDDEKLAVLYAESDNMFFENPNSRDSFEFSKDSIDKLIYSYKGMTLEAIKIKELHVGQKKT